MATRPLGLGLSFVFLAACSACGDDGMPTIDAPPDPCMPEMQVTGEYVDWDSTAATFMGVFGATFTLRADPSKTATTAPNGRFILCVPAADGLIDITPMTGSDYIGGTLVVNKAVIQSGATLSLRSFKSTRAADFSFDAAKAHVYVHVDGGSRTATTSNPAAVQKHFDGTWVDGNTGTDIYLGNIDPQAMTSLSVPNTAKGAGSIPLTAGKFTYAIVTTK
jgi:hypothetical protein